MASKLLAMALCLALLCACSPISLSIEELLAPPRLNERQTKVEEALNASVNLGTVLYKYPQRGDYRSPFVFYDLDKDGRQEMAIVFYTHRSDTDNIRAKIMRETEAGDWVLAYDLSGQGDQIDFIQFSPLLDKDGECMLIGWQDTRRDAASLGVYSFEGDQFKREATMSYRSLDVDDYLGNGLRQIALIRQDSSGYYQLVLLGKTLDGRIASVGEESLSQEVNSVLQVRRGRLWNNTYGIFVDERRTDTNIATEIVSVSARGLTTLVGKEDSENYQRTFRSIEALSLDLLGNGFVDIPTFTELPGYVSNSGIAPPPLTEYIRLTDSDVFETVYSAVINNDAGYLVFFPERWLKAVTVMRKPDSNEWQFYKIDPVSNLPTVELLRIWVYSTRDYDQFTSDYILLEEKGLFQYSAYIPKTADEPLAITQGELERIFMLL